MDRSFPYMWEKELYSPRKGALLSHTGPTSPRASTVCPNILLTLAVERDIQLVWVPPRLLSAQRGEAEHKWGTAQFQPMCTKAVDAHQQDNQPQAPDPGPQSQDPWNTCIHYQTTPPLKEPQIRQLWVKGCGAPAAPGLLSHPQSEEIIILWLTCKPFIAPGQGCDLMIGKLIHLILLVNDGFQILFSELQAFGIGPQNPRVG